MAGMLGCCNFKSFVQINFLKSVSLTRARRKKERHETTDRNQRKMITLHCGIEISPPILETLSINGRISIFKQFCQIPFHVYMHGQNLFFLWRRRSSPTEIVLESFSSKCRVETFVALFFYSCSAWKDKKVENFCLETPGRYWISSISHQLVAF